MEKKEVGDLAVMELDGGELYVPLQPVQQLMKARGMCRIYMVEPEIGHYVGIVSWQDMLESGDSYVQIRKNIPVIRENNFLKAKKIMQENGAGFLPVIDSRGFLLGEFDGEDDHSYASDKVLNFRDPAQTALSATYRLFRARRYGIVLVRPLQEKNVILYNRLTELFRANNVPFDIADEVTIVDCLAKQVYIIFPDKNEYHAMQAVCRNSLRGKAAYMPYRSLFDEVERMQSDQLDYRLLKELLSDTGDVSIFVVSNAEKENSAYMNGFKEQKKASGFPQSQDCKAFFEDLYSPEYVQSLREMPFSHTRVDGVNSLKDSNHPFYHVKNGERVTCGVPETYERTVWFFGPCVVVGSLVEDKFTIESLLQRQLNEAGYSVQVRNEGAWGGMLGRILSTRFISGDIVVIYGGENQQYDFPGISLPELAEKHSMPYAWFTDTIVHCNQKANAVWAKELFALMRGTLDKKPEVRVPVRMSKQLYLRNTYLSRYFYDSQLLQYGKIGAIVMNCNPFTLGHRYLIEESVKQVDFLIIFVVEEDRSMFSFMERYHMVKDGVRDLENVKVVPGGAFILSQITFPEYFIKIKDEDIITNVEYDVSLFAEFIAKPLGISCRFVGEEKEDQVTAEYNTAMKRILPRYDISLTEIPRVRRDDVIISASRVRKAMEEGDLDRAGAMLPESSREYIFLNSGSNSGKTLPVSVDRIGKNYLYPLFRILSLCHPHHILEFNFDDVSRQIARYMEKTEGSQTVLDFDRQRVEYKISKWKLPMGKTRILGSALLGARSGEFTGVIYQDFERIVEGKQYDLILLKCPFGGGRCTHMDLLIKLPELVDKDFAILMDHIETESGNYVFQSMKNILTSNGRKIYMTEFSEQDCKAGLIISEGWQVS